MKRLLLLLICLGLLLLPILACAITDDMDDEALAQLEEATATPNPFATPEPPEQVYAISDVNGEDMQTVIVQGERPDYIELLLDIARGEIGYVEGLNNFSKYGQWSGDSNAAWCAEFVCWCVAQVDTQHGTDLLANIYPNYSGQNTGRDWYIKRGRFVYRKGNCPDWGYQWLNGTDHLMKKNEYIPQPGDFVFFSYNEAGDTEHVALVEYCAMDAQGNVVIHVIEGNNPSTVQRNSYFLNNSQVLGFGTPEVVAGTTMHSGNRGERVLWLQQMLNQLGLLEEKHLTGAFGGNTRRAVADFQTKHLRGKNATGLADRETQQAIEKEFNEQVFNAPDSWLVEE